MPRKNLDKRAECAYHLIMIVEMRKGATPEEIAGVVQRAESLRLGTDKAVVALLGSNTGELSTDIFALLPGVESVARIMKSYKLASGEFKAEDSVVSVNGIEIGGKHIVVMAGPCAVESEEQLTKAVRAVKKSGACIVRGCLQTTYLPLQLSGSGEGWPGVAGES